MAAPSRSSVQSPPTVLTNPTNGTVSSGQSQSSGSSSSFGGIEDPQALEALSILISQLQRGETPGQQQMVERNKEITRTRDLSRDYSKGAAFLDAENAVNQALRKSQESNMPAIVKSIQGAGTSASSMQGLLAQRLATDSAQAAGALGAKQAVDYGQISANLQSVLEALTRTNDPGTDNLLKAAGLLKVDRSASQQQSSQSQSSSGGGRGGSYIANGGGPSGGSSYLDLSGSLGGYDYTPTDYSYYSSGASPSSDIYGGSYGNYFGGGGGYGSFSDYGTSSGTSYGSSYDNNYSNLNFVSPPSSSSSFGYGNDYFSGNYLSSDYNSGGSDYSSYLDF